MSELADGARVLATDVSGRHPIAAATPGMEEVVPGAASRASAVAPGAALPPPSLEPGKSDSSANERK